MWCNEFAVIHSIYFETEGMFYGQAVFKRGVWNMDF